MTKTTWSAIRAHLKPIVPCSNRVVPPMCSHRRWRRCILHRTSASPGHFNGVCQVVSRLFYIVRPDRAYFGEKDWQQIAVVKALVRFLGLGVQIVECDTVREADGLAKSSRNTLLAADERAIAPKIYEALKASKEYAKDHTLKETHDKVVADINAVDGLEVEYFSIVDGNTLLDVAQWDDSDYIAGCITVYCGKTPIRLIDHITYKNK